MLSDRLIGSVKKHEGYRSKAYQDSLGVWTIGYGTNLQTLEIPKELAEDWLVQYLRHEQALLETLSVYRELNEVRQEVLIEMAYQLGHSGLRKFKKMWAALVIEDYKWAATEMLDSTWHKQTPKRAEELAERMRTGL